MSDRLQPALWGGLFIGVLSALPLVAYGNCCCCLWVLIGGGLAAYLRQQNTSFQISAGEGAIVGLLAGLVGAFVGMVVAIPFQMISGPMQRDAIERFLANPDIPPEMRQWMEWFFTSSAAWVFGLVLSIVVDSLFGLLGGLIGVAIFKKNLPPPPPPGTIDITPSPMAPPPSPMVPPPPPPPPPPPVEV
jgi:uncharacterized membrane protein YeaQ/YmgE (transglycosylase-associated protein family)